MANVYEMITDKFIKIMEAGQIPWQKPWFGISDVAFNRVTGKSYSLLNQMLLSKPGEWASFKQWSTLGGKIRKGEKSEFVVFWKILKEKTESEDGKTTVKTIPLLRYYPVFHISQIEGVEPKERAEMNHIDPIVAAEEIKKSYSERESIVIDESPSNSAFYSPSRDFISVPARGQFTNANQFYATLFHEMVHSTGHWNRLGRFEEKASIAAFGSEVYSKEELVAEMGSAFLLNHVGIDTEKTFTNSAAYLQSWLKQLKSDSRFVVSAASKAQKAVEYIIGE